MTELSKERRAKLERKLKSGNSVPVKDVRIDSDELRALLDLADERDRFRELLEAVWYAWPRNITAETLNRIKAALEGKNND